LSLNKFLAFLSHSAIVVRVSKILVPGIQVQVPVQVQPGNVSQLIKSKSPILHISFIKIT